MDDNSMENFIFLTKPVWWSGQVPVASIIIASTIAMMYIVFRFLRNMKTLVDPRQGEYTFIAETDSEFAMRTLENLKEYLTHIHDPRRVVSHTVDEIRGYIKNTELLELLDKLERAEYSKKPLTREETKATNIFLAKMISQEK